MLPLRAVACGLIVVLFDLNLGDPQVDVVADPLGWAAAFHGVRRLPESFGPRSALVVIAGVAGGVSLLQWIPGFSVDIGSAPEQLLWVLALPGLAFFATLAVGMRGAATSAGDASAGSW